MGESREVFRAGRIALLPPQKLGRERCTIPAFAEIMESVDEGAKHARILIVDDDEFSAFALARILKTGGYAICITLTNPVEAMQRFTQINPDLVLLDLHMEPINGVGLLYKLHRELPPQLLPPFLMLTGDTTVDAKRDALAAGATDFLSKPLDQYEVLLRIKNLLRNRFLYRQCQNYSLGLERLVADRTAELQRQAKALEEALQSLKETQQQMIQQERLRALGTMASGIAHDLNNSLSIIMGYGDLLSRNAWPEESQERHFLRGILTAAEDSAHMVKRLREFYRPRTDQESWLTVDLNAVIEETIEMTAPRWQNAAEARGIGIRVDKKSGTIPPIAVDPAEIREVLTNLIFNAIDAMPRGGTISLRTRRDEEWVVVEVEDSGVGMTPETVEHCFEPFYTTKGENGTGLGLSVAYGIMRRHGGHVAIRSRVRKGTLVTLRLPIVQVSSGRKKERRAPSVAPLRVLLVDDHSAIREIVGAYLAEDRHIVETAENGAEALTKFRERPFDLVITDRAMPEMNGDALAMAIKEMQPREPVILFTGFADLLKETGQESQNVDLVLSKPARLDDLRRAIAQVMPS